MTAPAPSQGAAHTRGQGSNRALLLVLALGLVHGLAYVALFPPWQHYDEPSHLEYVLLIVRRSSLPRSGDYDLSLRHEIASSMVATGFYKGQATPVIDFWSGEPPGIGVDELVHPPLYYLLLALAVRPFAHQSVEVQLYVARLCSVCLYLVVLLAAYKIVAESFPRRPWMPSAVAVFLALLPPFTDRMSSVNNDVGAAAAASLLLWASVALAQRGLSAHRVVLVLVLVGLCMATKSTAGIVALAVVGALALSYVPRKWRRWLWAGAGCLALGVLVVLLTRRGHAASWYSTDPSGASNRVSVQTPLDNSSFVLARQGASGPQEILQELPVEEGRALRGHTVTLGGWVRAAEGAEGTVLFGLDEGERSQTWIVRATSVWELHTFSSTISQDAPGLALHVSVRGLRGAARTVYLDGLYLVDAPPAGEGATPANAAASHVTAGGRELPNLLRNGSAAKSWPSVPSALGNQVLGRSSVAEILSSIWDWRRTGWVLRHEIRVLFRSFWGGFGWNHLSLPDSIFYVLSAVTGLALAGAALTLARHLGTASHAPSGQWRIWLVFATALVAGWGMALVRIYPVFVTMRIWWPVARYADVVIVPVAALLCGGLATFVPRRLSRAAGVVGLIGLLALDALAIGLVIVPYYYR